MRAEEEMVGSDTPRVVAPMKDQQSVGDRTVVDLPGEPARSSASAWQGQFSVAELRAPASPGPAVFALLDKSPEAINMSEIHAALPLPRSFSIASATRGLSLRFAMWNWTMRYVTPARFATSWNVKPARWTRRPRGLDERRRLRLRVRVLMVGASYLMNEKLSMKISVSDK